MTAAASPALVGTSYPERDEPREGKLDRAVTALSMPSSYGYQARDLTHIKDICKKFYCRDSLKKIPTISLAGYILNRFVKGIKVINILDHYEYNREVAKQTLFHTYGWNDYGEKHEESLFTRWFQNVWLYKKHGIDKRRAHLASLIHSDQLPRDEALRILETPPYEVDFPFDDRDFYHYRIIENQESTTASITTTAVGGAIFVHQYIKPVSHYAYKTAEKWWNLLSKAYAYLPKFGRLRH